MSRSLPPPKSVPQTKGPVDNVPVLAAELPSGTVRAFAAFLILLGVGAVLIAVLVPFPEVVSAQFVLAPIRGADPVRAPSRGIVDRVVATEGAEVRTGDTLFVLRDPDAPARQAARTVVMAPFDGVIVSVQVKRGDTQVERGDALCRMSPADSPLRAEVEVPAKSVGLVAPGQSVRLLLESYPYTRFGTRKCTLSWIAPAGGQKGFPAMCALSDGGFWIRGVQRPLRPGMVGQARIDVGRRTLLDYAMEPLRQLKENTVPSER